MQITLVLTKKQAQAMVDMFEYDHAILSEPDETLWSVYAELTNQLTGTLPEIEEYVEPIT